MAGCSVLRALRKDELAATSLVSPFLLVTSGGTDVGAGTPWTGREAFNVGD